MSSTNRGAARHPDDFYVTPAWCVERLLEACPLYAHDVLEPCAGDGAIIRAARLLGSHQRWTAVELRAEERPALDRLAHDVAICDYLARPHPGRRFDLAITNPPFSLARRFVEKMEREAHIVAVLLRLAFLETAERAEMHHTCMPDVYVLPDRPSFTGGPTDSCAYAWFVWPLQRDRRQGRVQVLATTPRSERRATKDQAP